MTLEVHGVKVLFGAAIPQVQQFCCSVADIKYIEDTTQTN